MMAEQTANAQVTKGYPRAAGLDVLRCLLMCMMVTLHYLGQTGAVMTVASAASERTAAISSSVRYLGMLIESLALPTFNTLVLMSGYLLSVRPFRLRRFFELLFAVLFYGLLILLIVSLLTDWGPEGLYETVQSLFPVSGAYYWYLSLYLLLYPLSPVLGAGVQALDQKTLKTVITLLLIWTCGIKSLVPVHFATDEMGYSLSWMIVLYLIGAYIRKYEASIRFGRGKALLLYFCSTLLIFILSVLLYPLYLKTGSFAQALSMLTDYNFVLNLTGAVGLFLVFLQIRKKEGGILFTIAKKISPDTLGVYLLHAHPLLFDRWILMVRRITFAVPAQNPGLFLLHLALCVLIVFVCGILADRLRRMLFDLIAAKVIKE